MVLRPSEFKKDLYLSPNLKINHVCHIPKLKCHLVYHFTVGKRT